MNPFNLSENQMLLFMIMFVRVGALIFFTPILGGANVPSHAKIGLAFFVAVMLLPLVDFKFIELMAKEVCDIFISTRLGTCKKTR